MNDSSAIIPNTPIDSGVENRENYFSVVPQSPVKLHTISDERVFLTSDTHFSHKNILLFEPNARQFASIEEMNDEMVRRWNSVVGKDDIVFHLGDFSFQGYQAISTIFPQLNGHISLLLGNHDRYRKWDWTKIGFQDIYTVPFVLDDKFILSHEPLKDIPEGMVNVYGHVHSHPSYNTVDSNRICVCTERWNLTPISLKQVKGLFVK